MPAQGLCQDGGPTSEFPSLETPLGPPLVYFELMRWQAASRVPVSVINAYQRAMISTESIMQLTDIAALSRQPGVYTRVQVIPASSPICLWSLFCTRCPRMRTSWVWL